MGLAALPQTHPCSFGCVKESLEVGGGFRSKELVLQGPSAPILGIQQSHHEHDQCKSCARRWVFAERQIFPGIKAKGGGVEVTVATCSSCLFSLLCSGAMLGDTGVTGSAALGGTDTSLAPALALLHCPRPLTHNSIMFFQQGPV